MIQSLEDFKTYQRAMDIGDKIHKEVVQWNYFERDTVGKQLVRSADSIAANLSEGLGRCHFKEQKNFSYYSRGSLFETKTWLHKALNRELIEETTCRILTSELEEIGKMINKYIKSIGTRIDVVKESNPNPNPIPNP